MNYDQYILDKIAKVHMKTIRDLSGKVSYEVPKVLFRLFDKRFKSWVVGSCAEYLEYMNLKNSVSFSNGDSYSIYLIMKALGEDTEIDEYLNKIQMMLELMK